MSYDQAFGEKSKCTELEKKHAIILLKEILELSKKARTAGFIVLSKDSESIKNKFLRDSIKLVGKGYDYSAVERILDIRISVRNSSGVHLLEMAMVKEGVLSILRGDPISLTEEILFSFLGLSISEEHQNEQNQNYTEYVSRLSKADRTAKTKPGKWLLGARDNEISFLLKAFDWESLATLLKTETNAVLYRVYSNLTNEAGKLFRERLQTSKTPDDKSIETAEGKFNTIISKMGTSKITVESKS
jgi:hypothetical protein